jgi:trans-aconitate methyltransferase
MSLWSKIAAQFGKPTGLLGNLAGFIMASRSSNVERCNWAVSLLNLQSTDRVLEIGFGPGIAIQKMSEIVKEGVIWGIDHSDIMLKQASKRNKEAISSGRIKLLLNSVSNLPSFEEPLDKMLDINSFQFWENPIEDLKSLRDHLRLGGLIALVQQPRKPGAKEEDTIEAGEKFAEYLKAAGFKEIKIEQKKMKPVSTVCVLGKK